MNLFKIVPGLILAGALISSCETDDVEGIPGGALVTLSVDKSSITEDAGTAQVTASLSESTATPVTVNLSITGTATGNGTDYFTDSETITIAAGSLEGSITITAVQDTLKEGNESVNVAIASANGASLGATIDVSVIIEDDDVPFQVQLIVNEILYDPSNSDLDGDANGDGSYAQSEDEFIEFVNLSSQTVDLSGYMIYDTEDLAANTPNHIFPANTLVAPGKAIVVFGGGTPTGSFGGAVVQTSTSGDLNLNNAGDEMTLTDPDGTVIVSMDIEPLSNNPNESYTRDPDISGEFVQHSTVNSALFSPGTKVDGSSF